MLVWDIESLGVQWLFLEKSSVELFWYHQTNINKVRNILLFLKWHKGSSLSESTGLLICVGGPKIPQKAKNTADKFDSTSRVFQAETFLVYDYFQKPVIGINTANKADLYNNYIITLIQTYNNNNNNNNTRSKYKLEQAWLLGYIGFNRTGIKQAQKLVKKWTLKKISIKLENGHIMVMLNK